MQYSPATDPCTSFPRAPGPIAMNMIDEALRLSGQPTGCCTAQSGGPGVAVACWPAHGRDAQAAVRLSVRSADGRSPGGAVMHKELGRRKSRSGFFAAGAEFERALGVLGDGALKVYARACLHAEPPRRLDKNRSALGRHLRGFESAGVCDLESSPNEHRGPALTVHPAYWPSLHSTIFRGACFTLGRRDATARKKCSRTNDQHRCSKGRLDSKIGIAVLLCIRSTNEQA